MSYLLILVFGVILAVTQIGVSIGAEGPPEKSRQGGKSASVKAAARKQLLNFDRLKKEWGEVRKTHPQLVAAYLESLEMVAECGEQKPKGETPEPKPLCPRCRPATDREGIEGYLECLDKRIHCLTP